MPPQGDLCDRGADQHEQNGDLDVVSVRDGEPQAWLGEEEVEPDAA